MLKKDQNILNDALKTLEERTPLVIFKADDRVKFFPLIGKILEEQLRKMSAVQDFRTIYEDELSYIGNSSWGEIAEDKDHYLDPQLINCYPFPDDFRKLMGTVNFALTPLTDQGRACGIVIFFDGSEDDRPGIKAILNRAGQLQFVDDNVQLPEKVCALLRSAIVVQYHDLIVPTKPRGQIPEEDEVENLVDQIGGEIECIEVGGDDIERRQKVLRVAHKRNLTNGKTSLDAAIAAWNANTDLRDEIQPGGKVTWVRPVSSLFELDNRPIKGQHTKFLRFYINTVRPLMQLDQKK